MILLQTLHRHENTLDEVELSPMNTYQNLLCDLHYST